MSEQNGKVADTMIKAESRCLTRAHVSRNGARHVRTPRDPAQSLYSASRMLHTAADVRRGRPERQASCHREHILRYQILRA